jgi:hypothetical protein
MRKLIDANAMSLDGYYAAPDNKVMVLELDPAFHTYTAERLGAAGTLLLGAGPLTDSRAFGLRWLMTPIPGRRPRSGRCPGLITRSTRWLCQTA